MENPSRQLPENLAEAHAVIKAQRAELLLARSELTVGRLEIERLKLLLAKARREQFGQSSERGKLLVEQLELAIEDLEETQAAQEAGVGIAAPEAAAARPARTPRGPRKLPENLPVERVVEPAPCACGKCGGTRLRKLGEAAGKPLECEPRRWKIIERRTNAPHSPRGAGKVHLAPIAMRSPSRPRPRIRFPRALPDQACWPWFWRASFCNTSR